MNQDKLKPILPDELDLVTIRFAGDSGDGMQLTGNQFTNTTAIFGNDLSTFPDYPSEIRAPAGSLAGVSSFQIQFSSKNIYTPGDKLDALVAMNPAALKVHLKDLKDHGIVIANSANYTKRNLQLAGWEGNPLEDDTLKHYRLIKVDMTGLVISAVKDMGITKKLASRSANMFALGIAYWLYDRSIDTTVKFLKDKFVKRPDIVEINVRAIKAGINFGKTIRAIKTTYSIPKAEFEKGMYRNVMGNQATSLGLLAASQKAGLELFYGGYPITPASDVLHYLSGYKNFGVKTFQAEDEIAGVISTIGASYAGSFAVTATSGPGMALKTEALTLAVSTELPMVIVNVQRGGPSTGLPTKTEQSDLFQAVIGRNGEAPIPVVAASSPSDCFDMAFEASRIALKHMMPVILLTDSYIANGSEPWKIPSLDELPNITTTKTTNPENFEPFRHDPETLARPWAAPGTKGMEHRIGGLEKQDGPGTVNYTPENHQHMTELRQRKVDIIAETIPLLEVHGEQKGDLLVLGWGSSFGAIRSAVNKLQADGESISHAHLNYINPFPKNLGEVLNNFKKILIPEMNLGQLLWLIRAKYLIDAQGYHKVQGIPFTITELYIKFKDVLEGKNNG